MVLSGEGEHFCAGLDLSEVSERTVAEGMHHSRAWHACFDAIQYGPVPVVAVLHGAVVGGGLELASAAHLRVAEASAFYGLPEGTRGIFVGGGGSVRISRLIGVSRMTDMMLTGRVFDADEGQAFGVSNYLVEAGQGLHKALALAQQHRRQRAAVELRHHPGPAAHRRPAARRGPLHGDADVVHRPGRRGGQGTRARLPREACGQGGAAGRLRQEAAHPQSAPAARTRSPQPQPASAALHPPQTLTRPTLFARPR
ncbi:MAG UNVERIFIED_CONTAM: crotonase/enoyl-CoA hydratase family protein [Microcystis novacekii LVE1205-3]